ncbi:MAG TPA: glycosyltransferase [Chloroflexota bacterium]
MPRPCTVVICTRDRPEALDRCLGAVSALDYPSFDVLVVDNGSSATGTREVAERWGARCTVEPRPGLSRARNRGARESQGDLIAYLDDDALPEPGWLAALERELDDPAVMAVAGRIRPTRLETAAECLFEATGGFTPNRGSRRVVDTDTPGWFGLTNFGGVGTGASMAFRRAAFDRWPGFDPRLGLGGSIRGGEEHYAFFCLVELGYRVVYAPAAVVRHPYPATLADLRARHVATVGSSAAYLLHLLLEAPRCRRLALAFALRGLRGAGPPPVAAAERARLGPWWQTYLTALGGALGYAWQRGVQVGRVAPTPDRPHARPVAALPPR